MNQERKVTITMCDFCAGITFKKIPGGNMYMRGDTLYLCGEAANMAPEHAKSLGTVSYCLECGTPVKTQIYPVCEVCGQPYKVEDDATTDLYYSTGKLSVEIKRGTYATYEETGEMCVIPVRSVVPSCNCKECKN